MSRNIVVVAGIETVRDKNGKVLKFSQTFLNNACTYKKDRPKDNVIIVDARQYVPKEDPIADLLHDVRMSFGHDEGLGIDELVYTGHSDSERLYVFSRVRTDLDDSKRFLDGSSEWTAPYNKDAVIRLLGCQAGGQRGKRWDVCVAQDIANKARRTVYAYMCRTAQKKRQDGGFEQRPDFPGFGKFEPQAVENSTKEPEEKQTSTPS